MALTQAPAELLNLDSGITITTADNTDQLTLLSTDADASQGPSMAFYRNSSSPADSDDMGNIFFYGENDADEKIEYGRVRSILLDASDGTEDSNIRFWTMAAGTLTDNLTLAGGNVGIGTTTPSSFDSLADNLVVGTTSGNNGITIAAATDGNSSIYFADGTSSNAEKLAGYVQYGHSANSLSFGTSSNLGMKIDSAGHVTMPLQSSAGVTATAQSDIGSLTTLDFDTERFDQNSDFNTSTNTFTAPVTGKYLVCANVWVNNLNNAHDYHQLYVVTSNNTYYSIYDTSVLTGSAAYWTFPFSGVVDMDASDTVLFKLLPGGSGTATADLIALSYISVTLLN